MSNDPPPFENMSADIGVYGRQWEMQRASVRNVLSEQADAWLRIDTPEIGLPRVNVDCAKLYAIVTERAEQEKWDICCVGAIYQGMREAVLAQPAMEGCKVSSSQAANAVFGNNFSKLFTWDNRKPFSSARESEATGKEMPRVFSDFDIASMAVFADEQTFTKSLKSALAFQGATVVQKPEAGENIRNPANLLAALLGFAQERNAHHQHVDIEEKKPWVERVGAQIEDRIRSIIAAGRGGDGRESGVVPER